jgi:hypothetical protein
MRLTARIPHNRKWPIYTMPVGRSVTIENPPKRLRFDIYRRVAPHGIVLSVRRINSRDPMSDLVVTRRA